MLCCMISQAGLLVQKAKPMPPQQGLLKGLSAKVHAAKSDADGAKTELRGARASLTAVDSTAADLKHAQKELQLMAERLREERHAAAGLRRRLQQQQVGC